VVGLVTGGEVGALYEVEGLDLLEAPAAAATVREDWPTRLFSSSCLESPLDHSSDILLAAE